MILRKFTIATFGISFLAQGFLWANFPKPTNTQKTDLTLPSPKEAVAGMSLPDGFKINCFASEPMVRQPIAMAFDDRNRLWVAECYTYAEARTNFDLKLRDRIVILEDVNGDGRADKKTIFHDDLQRLTGLTVGFGGVWVTCAPNLLFIPDADKDDKPDGEPIVLLDGWNDNSVRHNMVNGLKWGPDGWLYGRHGIQALSVVGPPGTPKEKRTQLKCSIWRLHPQTKKFEVVCEGTTNPWGHDWDEHGQLFFINTVIGHFWHGLPGAYFKRMYGQHFRSGLYGLIDQQGDHFHWDVGKEAAKDVKKKMSLSTDEAGGGHAHCGMMIYQGGQWPDQYKGKVFTANFHGRRINCDRIERAGAGYVAKHEPDFMKAKDLWFRGVELDYDMDGTVFVLDWSDVGECHENDGIHRTSGRIYKITYGNQKPGKHDLAKKSSEELANLLENPNKRIVRHSARLLQERSSNGVIDKKTVGTLKKKKNGKTIDERLQGLWGLHRTGNLKEKELLSLVKDKEEHMRIWALKLLVDEGKVSKQASKAIIEQAQSEKSSLVRLHLASIMRNLSEQDRWKLAGILSSSNDLKEDPVFPLMVWYGIEGQVKSDPAKALQLAKTSKLQTLTEWIPRRLAE
jgi:putative membrane-bound dehydrogenase-like protein